jgi:hypothetical protein
MVWDAFSLHHRPPLYHVQGNLTRLMYRDEILARLVVPTLQLTGPGSILQDDNARPHPPSLQTTLCKQHRIYLYLFGPKF